MKTMMATRTANARQVPTTMPPMEAVDMPLGSSEPDAPPSGKPEGSELAEASGSTDDRWYDVLSVVALAPSMLDDE